MPYSKELKVFWFLPMRAATRSCRPIVEYLNFYDSNNHWFINNLDYLDYYLIANVRNPYSRLVSLYNHAIETKQISEKITFELWSKKKIPYEMDDKFVIPTQMYISLMKAFKNKMPDYFVRFEYLEEDLNNLWLIKENFNDELNSIFDTSIRHNSYKSINQRNWQSFYTEELAEFVYDYLKEDFTLLNYNKNSWKDGSS
jgi:hypothetical protein